MRYVLPVLWMTSCFHIMERMGRIRDEYNASSSPGGGTGFKVCRLWLHLVVELDSSMHDTVSRAGCGHVGMDGDKKSTRRDGRGLARWVVNDARSSWTVATKSDVKWRRPAVSIQRDSDDDLVSRLGAGRLAVNNVTWVRRAGGEVSRSDVRGRGRARR